MSAPREIRIRDMEVTASQSHRLPEEIIFSLAGILRVSESPPWTPRSKMYITKIVTLMTQAGTSATTLALNTTRSGTPLATIVLAAGETMRVDDVEIELIPFTDILSASVVVAGGGEPTGVSITLWFA